MLTHELGVLLSEISFQMNMSAQAIVLRPFILVIDTVRSLAQSRVQGQYIGVVARDGGLGVVG